MGGFGNDNHANQAMHMRKIQPALYHVADMRAYTLGYVLRWMWRDNRALSASATGFDGLEHIAQGREAGGMESINGRCWMKYKIISIYEEYSFAVECSKNLAEIIAEAMDKEFNFAYGYSVQEVDNEA